MAKKTCSRCGQCCMQASMWVNSSHPLIARIVKAMVQAGATEIFRDGGPNDPCDMLVLEDGKATCLIHKYLGYECKPNACQEYPEPDEACLKP